MWKEQNVVTVNFLLKERCLSLVQHPLGLFTPFFHKTPTGRRCECFQRNSMPSNGLHQIDHQCLQNGLILQSFVILGGTLELHIETGKRRAVIKRPIGLVLRRKGTLSGVRSQRLCQIRALHVLWWVYSWFLELPVGPERLWIFILLVRIVTLIEAAPVGFWVRGTIN